MDRLRAALTRLAGWHPDVVHAHDWLVAHPAVALADALGVPLFTPDWKPAGSLMLLEVPDRAGLDAYLAAEPFAAGEVWKRVEAHPFRIAPLPYRPLPRPGAPVASSRTHTVIVARDGADEGAEARRLGGAPGPDAARA